MKGFPQPVFKKFSKKEEAEEFLKKHQPESTTFEATENDTDDKFYAIARGRIIGIFKDWETVRKNIKGFPGALHKRFNTFAEAKSYFEKYAEGKVEEKKTPKKRAHAEEGGGDDGGHGMKSVARKRTTGKVGETDESDGGEHADTTQSSIETNESIADESAVDANAKGGEDGPKPMDTTENVEEKKEAEQQIHKKDAEDAGDGKKSDEPDNKQAKMSEE